MEVGSPCPGYAPATVMQFHVVEAAEQDPSIDVGSPAVAVPFVDVVGLAVRGRAVASGPEAAAVAQREGDALPSREEALFAADVERVAARVDTDGDDAGVAHGASAARRRSVPPRRLALRRRRSRRPS